MIRQRIIYSLRRLAISLEPQIGDTQWHLFGSVDRDESDAADIDLMILCNNDGQADMLRSLIDPDAFLLPIHLALMTFDEAIEVNAIHVQKSRVVFP